MSFETFLKKCNLILDKNDIIESEEEVKNYSVDRTKDYLGNASLALFPRNTSQVQEIIKLANQNKISIVPSGGRTGYSGGAVATKQEVIVSLTKMNQILNFYPEIPSVEAEAGVITKNLQDFAIQKGFFFPLDLASSGSSQIGGNIATNAGGIRVIRYGHIRNWVLGLEVVDGKGEILNFSGNLIKNNTGYDLKQLFIGSEGTLGIITRATLMLTNLPNETVVYLLVFPRFDSVIECLKVTKKFIHNLLAFECFNSSCLHLVCQKHDLVYPFPDLKDQEAWYVLVEAELEPNSHYEIPFENYLNELDSLNLINVTFSTNQSGKKSLFRYREDISEAVAMSGKFHKNDISVPINSLTNFIEEIQILVKEKFNDFQLFLFGHAGDGNIHINLLAGFDYPDKEFQYRTSDFDLKIYEIIQKFKGSISAEHGIGLLKKSFLRYSRSQEEIEYMKSIKKLFDPLNILNPGKIFNL